MWKQLKELEKTKRKNNKIAIEFIGKKKFIKSSTASQFVDIRRDTISRWIKAGYIKGKRIRNNYYLTRKAFTKLLRNPCKDHEPIKNYPMCCTHQEKKATQKKRKEAAEGKTPETLPF